MPGGAGGGTFLWLLLQASPCQMEGGEKKSALLLVFGPLFLLALVVFYQHLCCRSAFPWRPLRVLSLFFVGALFKLILDSKHDVCCRMWMFCSCKCTFKLDQKLQYTLNSNMPFVKVTNCYCCCCYISLLSLCITLAFNIFSPDYLKIKGFGIPDRSYRSPRRKTSVSGTRSPVSQRV